MSSRWQLLTPDWSVLFAFWGAIVAPNDKFEEVQVDQGTKVTLMEKLSPNFYLHYICDPSVDYIHIVIFYTCSTALHWH